MRRSSTLESQRIEFESMQCPGGILLLEGGGCQLFHHPLLTKSVFSAIGRIRVLRIGGHVWNAQRDWGVGEGRGGGDLSSADPAHYSPPTTRLTTRQLLRELGLSRFEVRQLPIDTNSLLGSRVGYLCFKLVTWRRWKHQWKLLSLIDGGSRKTRKNYFFII